MATLGVQISTKQLLNLTDTRPSRSNETSAVRKQRIHVDTRETSSSGDVSAPTTRLCGILMPCSAGSYFPHDLARLLLLCRTGPRAD